MICGLFSVFDSSSSYFNMYWMVFFLFSAHSKFYSDAMMHFIIVLTTPLAKEIFSLLKKDSMKTMMIPNLSILFIIMYYNFSGLCPYFFPFTSHLVFSLSYGLFLWLSFSSLMINNYLLNFLSHLVPLNTPLILIHFMVLIELISNFIRPITLSIRLMANITAGHLIMTLVSMNMPNLEFMPINILKDIQMILTLMELGVSMIQAYVYSVLLTMYTMDFII